MGRIKIPKPTEYDTTKEFRSALWNTFRKVGWEEFDKLPSGYKERLISESSALIEEKKASGARIPTYAQQKAEVAAKEMFADKIATSAVHKYDTSGSVTMADIRETVSLSRDYISLGQMYGRNMLKGFESEDEQLFKEFASKSGIYRPRNAKGQIMGRRTALTVATSGALRYNNNTGIYEYTDDSGIIWEIRTPQYDKNEKLMVGYGYRMKGEETWTEVASGETKKVRHYKRKSDFPTLADWQAWKARRKK